MQEYNLTTTPKSSWKDINQSLQKLITDNQERIKSDIITHVENPILQVVPTKKYNLPIKIQLTRDDYYALILYNKYLIEQNQTKKATQNYIQAIQGLNQTDKSSTFFSMIFHTVMSRIILQSLQHDLHYLTKEDRALLKSKHPSLLKINEKDFDLAVKLEIEENFKMVRPTLVSIYGNKRGNMLTDGTIKKTQEFFNALFKLPSKAKQEEFGNEYVNARDKLFIKEAKALTLLNSKIQKSLKTNRDVLYIEKYLLKEIPEEMTLKDQTIIDLLYYALPKMKLGGTKKDLLDVLVLNKEVVKLLEK